jgi:putative oxidoreductase
MSLKDTGLLILRAGVGGAMAAHGAQKLFGAFDGPGLQGTAGFMNSLGLRPPHYWASAAAAGEFGGGALMALGLLGPLGSIGTISAMAMATQKAHLGKPFFAAQGGPEVPALYSTVALALAATGPGLYSVDKVLGLKMPRWLSATAAFAAAGVVLYGMLQEPDAPPPDEAQESAEEHQVATGAKAS